jgi:hypothetical protein
MDAATRVAMMSIPVMSGEAGEKSSAERSRSISSAETVSGDDVTHGLPEL